MIGYYVHHVGRGHLNRAIAFADLGARRGRPVTVLSSLPAPPDRVGDWVQLAPDAGGGAPCDPTARGRLHWAPLGHAGLRDRMAAVSAWIGSTRPDVMVVDVSVEVLLLSRLHGVPTVSVVLPGRRDDPAHLLGLDVADALVGFWPERAAGAGGMLRGVPDDVLRRLTCVGAFSRFAVAEDRDPGAGRRVALLLGRGGHDISAADIAAARAEAADWTWDVLDGSSDGWVEDPAARLAQADVLVAHAGQNALAEVAALRRPAVVLPQRRPHDEQVTTADVLKGGEWPALVRPRWPHGEWRAVLEEARELDGSGWAGWCDDGSLDRFAAVVDATRLRASR